MDNLIVAGIGFIGVIVGSCIPLLGDWFRSYSKNKKDGSYAAIRLIGLLEAYADNCIDVSRDHGEFAHDQWGYLKATVMQPDPPSYPDDIDWRSLKQDTMHRILSLPSLARSTGFHINSAFEHDTPPDFMMGFEARREGYARLADEALSLIATLRKQFSIKVSGRSELESGWDREAYLSDLLKAYAKRKTQATEKTDAGGKVTSKTDDE
jgi:hypothetical protein